MDHIYLIDKLKRDRTLTKEEWITLIGEGTKEDAACAAAEAGRLKEFYYGNHIFVRGLIEFTNYCKNDCYYCGICRSNHHAVRYRLDTEQILDCCEQGYELGYRTFVLQGGEDPYFTDERMTEIIRMIKGRFPDCAITLSIGEKEEESYRRFKEAGVDRYLLRHETADELHYSTLHPEELSLKHRKNCLYTLKRLGYQTGTGFMVGSPGQTPEHLAQDMMFLADLQPQMVGIGPFVPHHDTRFADAPGGTAEQTIYLLSLIRIMLPSVLLPATTALGTIDSGGREKGILAGANVVMPNLSPKSTREKYALYDNKIGAGEDAVASLNRLKQQVASIGAQIVTDRGDYREERQ